MSAQFGYTIAYVPSVDTALSFYERAFGLTRRFVSPDGEYGELETGATTLSFAAPHMAPIALAPNSAAGTPAGIELAFVVADVAAAYTTATAAGAAAVTPPELKPWGQTVAYVRDLNGILVELCTAMS